VGFDGAYILYITIAEHEISLQFNIEVFVFFFMFYECRSKWEAEVSEFRKEL
jgi:hypothetical protein